MPMEHFYRMAEASNKRFPDGVNPFQMETRLLEEYGEVAAEINHWEGAYLGTACRMVSEKVWRHPPQITTGLFEH